MRQLPKGDWGLRGTWHEAVFKEVSTDRVIRIPLVCCPTCGQEMSLSGHMTQPDGTVSPSVVCPLRCGFHDFVQLFGWGDSASQPTAEPPPTS